MSSSLDSGAWNHKGIKDSETPCKKSPTNKHKFTTFGSWPSTWKICKFCDLHVYSK